jgi:hypothetical protein
LCDNLILGICCVYGACNDAMGSSAWRCLSGRSASAAPTGHMCDRRFKLTMSHPHVGQAKMKTAKGETKMEYTRTET